MSGVLISLFTLILILVSVFLILIILMQKASSSGGMGAAMGGGMAESTFGTDTDGIGVHRGHISLIFIKNP